KDGRSPQSDSRDWLGLRTSSYREPAASRRPVKTPAPEAVQGLRRAPRLPRREFVLSAPLPYRLAVARPRAPRVGQRTRRWALWLWPGTRSTRRVRVWHSKQTKEPQDA